MILKLFVCEAVLHQLSCYKVTYKVSIISKYVIIKMKSTTKQNQT